MCTYIISGVSKGYGLIKYESSDAAAQARHLLGQLKLDCPSTGSTYAIDCDWLKSTNISFGSLHSKTLYVDNLPANYKDMAEGKRIFSVVQRPVFFQVPISINGVIHDWGLVQFFDPALTEATQRELNGYCLRGPQESKNIRVHFCIPGVNASDISLKYLQVRF